MADAKHVSLVAKSGLIGSGGSHSMLGRYSHVSMSPSVNTEDDMKFKYSLCDSITHSYKPRVTVKNLC